MSVANRPANDQSVIDRFRGWIAVSTTHFWRGTPCHLWQGGKSRGGDRWSEHAFYGTFNPGGVVKGGVRAHVYAAWIAGLIPELRVPEGMNIDHRCHQALCCNALHLEVVPAEINQQRKRNRKDPPVTAEEQADTPFVPEDMLQPFDQCARRVLEDLAQKNGYDVGNPHPDGTCYACEPVRPSPTGRIGKTLMTEMMERYDLHKMTNRNCEVIVIDTEMSYADIEARVLAIMGKGAGVALAGIDLASEPDMMGMALYGGDRKALEIIRMETKRPMMIDKPLVERIERQDRTTPRSIRETMRRPKRRKRR